MAKGNVVPTLTAAEHIGLEATGDNIEAKRVASYAFNGTQWGRAPMSFIDVSFDYIGFTNADANGNYQTWTFKTGGNAGTTVRTLSLTYDASSNITSIERT